MAKALTIYPEQDVAEFERLGKIVRRKHTEEEQAKWEGLQKEMEQKQKYLTSEPSMERQQWKTKNG